MSHSSALVIYQPEGAGQKPRRATFDLTLVPDPEPWLAERLGSLALCQIERPSNPGTAAAAESGLEEFSSIPTGLQDNAARAPVRAADRCHANQPRATRPTPCGRERTLAASGERPNPTRRCDGATNTTANWR